MATSNELPRSRQVLKEAWSAYKNRFWALQKMSWLPTAVMLVAGIVAAVLALAFVLMVGGFGDPARLQGIIANPLVFIPAVLIALALMLAFILFNVWCQIALVYMVGKGDIGVKQALADTRAKVASYLWVAILVSLVVIGGLLLFVIPGLYLAIATVFAVFIILFENERGLDALIKSREYVRGNIWRMVKYSLYLGLIVLPFYIVYIVLYSMVAGTRLEFVADLISSIATPIFAPLFVLYGYAVYMHIKQQKNSMVFAPTAKTRKKYMVLSILGALVLIVIVMTGVLFASLGSV
jgi:hypothetical protein